MKSTGRSLKPVLGITLVLALLFGLFLPSLVVLEFHMNRAEIIRTKCVQRALPEERDGSFPCSNYALPAARVAHTWCG